MDTFITVCKALIVIVNALIWLFNLAASNSSDTSGSGMVMMFTVPLGVCTLVIGGLLYIILSLL